MGLPWRHTRGSLSSLSYLVRNLALACLENSMDGGAWKAAVHGVTESRTRLSDFTFTFHFHALEKEMATHSSILAWRNPTDRGAWWATVHGVAKSQTGLSDLAHRETLENHMHGG